MILTEAQTPDQSISNFGPVIQSQIEAGAQRNRVAAGRHVAEVVALEIEAAVYTAQDVAASQRAVEQVLNESK